MASGTGSTWMADIAPAIENQKLNEIILPGTHESGTYNITPSSPYADDGNTNCADIANNYVKNSIEDYVGETIYKHIVEPALSPIINSVCPVIQADWSKSQPGSIYSQLTDGIRYIDLRVLYDGSKFQVIHSMVSTDIDTVLGDVKRFYQDPAHTGEIVILDINHTYKMNSDLDGQLISKINAALVDSSGQTLLIPRCADSGCTQPMDLTIKNLWNRSASQRVIAFYEDSTGDQSIVAAHPELWYNTGSNSRIISNWPNTTFLDALDAKLFADAWNNPNITNLQAGGGFYVLQTIRTANEGVIKDSLTTALWDNLPDIKTFKNYMKKAFDYFGWCTNCSGNLLDYGSETDAGNDTYDWSDKLFAPRANIIIIDNYPAASWSFRGNTSDYVSSVKQMNITRYCDMWLGPMVAQPGAWWGGENQGGDITSWDIDANGRPDIIVFHIDHPDNGNAGYYRIGWNVDNNGGVASWSGPFQIPGWWGLDSQGGGIAVADINGNGKPDLIAFNIDHPTNGNGGYYRIGWDMNITGAAASWSDHIQIPGWWGLDSQGGGIAVADINGNGKPDLIAFNIDHPTNGNGGYYRIGWDMNVSGAAASWSDHIQIPGWWGLGSQGGGIAVADINGNGKPDLIAFNIDHPTNGNGGYYRIGWDMNVSGAAASWSDHIQIPGWWGGMTDGGGIAVADINKNGRQDLLGFNIDHPGNGNTGWYRVGLDMKSDGTISGSRCSSSF